ncbi:MAG: flagellar hook-associated protein FlgL [Limnohabitans sp.]|jgi:flagellar hook-associated protein 3 FlgL
MKVSTTYLFDRAVDQMAQGQTRLAKSQAQLASSKQVNSPSDAPDQAATIERFKSMIGRQDSYETALNMVSNRLQAEESALSGVSDLMLRMKELAIQAANDTMGAADRKVLAIEMQGLRDQALSLANSKDSSGNYIFGGSRVKSPPFVADNNGNPTYQGDQTQMRVSVGDQRSVLLNRSGTETFTSVVRTNEKGDTTGVGFFQVIDEVIAGMRDGHPEKVRSGMNELDQLQNALSLSLAEVGTDQNVLESQQTVLDDTRLSLKTVLSGIEDLDYAKAITEMNKQVLSLEAAQSSFAKISQLNLFNYIN